MKDTILESLRYLWQERRAKSLGTAGGLVFGIAVLVFGFWQTFFVLLCGCIGFFIGSELERGDFLDDLRDRLPDKVQYWHPFERSGRGL